MKRTFIIMMCLIVQLSAHVYGKDQLPGTFKEQPAALGFEENKGQITDQYGNMRQDIQYTLKAPGLTVFIGSGAIHYQFYRTDEVKGIINPEMSKAFKGKALPVPVRTTTYRMDVSLPGANMGVIPVASEGMGGINHYYTNAQQKNGVAARTFQKLTYANIYPGVDWVLYVQHGKLKYDFMVHAGADAAAIRLQYNGASGLTLQKDGSLQAITPYGTITEQAPVAYQAEDRKSVASAFVLNNNILSYKVKDAYSGTLDIDPHVVWATYYGQGTENNSYNVACDPSGYIYMTVYTGSADNIATTGSFQDTLSTSTYSLLAKFDSLGNRIWATYFGHTDIYVPLFGGSLPTPIYVACDSNYHIYLAGTTGDSAGIATPGSHQDTVTPGGAYYGIPVLGAAADAFLVQFDTAGALQWGTYYGGNGFDGVTGVACGSRNVVDIYGSTGSTNGIATAGCYQNTIGPCVNCVTNGADTTGSFIAQFDNTGILQWGTYYGDGNQYAGYGIKAAVCDEQGNIDIVGGLSPDPTVINTAYATPGTFEPVSDGGYDTYSDFYVAQINSLGMRNWGTFWHPTDSADLGGGGPTAIACDNANHIYIAGSVDAQSGVTTDHNDFIQNFPNGTNVGYAGFITQFNGTNGGRNWATYYCSGLSGIQGLACDPGGFLYIAGITWSVNNVPPIQYAFATPYSYQDSLIIPPGYTSDPGTGPYVNEAFVAQFDSAGNRHWGTYFGGGTESLGGQGSLACDPFGNIYLLGYTSSSANVATPGSYQDTLGTPDAGTNQASNAFLVRFTPVDVAIIGLVHDTVCIGDNSISITLQNRGHLPESNIVSNAFYVYYDASTGISDTSTATTTTNSSLAPGATTIVTLSGLNLHPGTDTVQFYVEHFIDDSSFVDDTLYAAVVVIAAPTIGSINTTNTDSLYSFSATNAQNVTNYQWGFGDGNTATGANVSHLYAASGNYTVTLVASNGCKSDTITTSISAIGLGIAGINNTGNISIYPNPAQQTLNIQVPAGLQATEVSIINTVGAKMHTEKIDVQNATKSLDVHGLSDGYYILKVSTNQGYYNVPFEILN